ncbi:uncharacterized protein LOC121420757 [Lytechinus variegatus]|uniref:uncharacterized protein LOC121420757 n=1 Tax=Lytechinus variegatus TaxID=7654 RepID=UPI001BB261A4|nr:uncharacterized protein LOC121420757 [Lytechinus variegatus]
MFSCLALFTFIALLHTSSAIKCYTCLSITRGQIRTEPSNTRPCEGSSMQSIDCANQTSGCRKLNGYIDFKNNGNTTKKTTYHILYLGCGEDPVSDCASPTPTGIVELLQAVPPVKDALDEIIGHNVTSDDVDEGTLCRHGCYSDNCNGANYIQMSHAMVVLSLSSILWNMF